MNREAASRGVPSPLSGQYGSDVIMFHNFHNNPQWGLLVGRAERVEREQAARASAPFNARSCKAKGGKRIPPVPPLRKKMTPRCSEKERAVPSLSLIKSRRVSGWWWSATHTRPGRGSSTWNFSESVALRGSGNGCPCVLYVSRRGASGISETGVKRSADEEAVLHKDESLLLSHSRTV